MVKRGWGGVGIGREVWDGRGKDASLKRQNKRDLIYSIVLGAAGGSAGSPAETGLLSSC